MKNLHCGLCGTDGRQDTILVKFSTLRNDQEHKLISTETLCGYCEELLTDYIRKVIDATMLNTLKVRTHLIRIENEKAKKE